MSLVKMESGETGAMEVETAVPEDTTLTTAEEAETTPRSRGTNSTQDTRKLPVVIPSQRVPSSRPTTSSSSDDKLASSSMLSPSLLDSTEAGEAALSASESSTAAVAQTTGLVRAEERPCFVLLSLPIDSLHCVASFLDPKEWSDFGRSSRVTSRICREIFRRVRMHGFRCATEVVTAWKLCQLADARELTALYIKTGVPIYPYCLGHSYRTLIWRMGIEAREMETSQVPKGTGQEDDSSDSSTEPGHRRVDRFYSDRYASRNPSLTYLEEKCLYWYNRDAPSSSRSSGGVDRRVSLTTSVSLAPTAPVLRARESAGEVPVPLPVFRPDEGAAHGFEGILPPRSTVELSLSSPFHVTKRVANTPRISIKVHRHLVDQHLLGRPSVDDESGTMRTAPVSLSADFFHPHVASPTSSVALSSRSDRPVATPNNGVGHDSLSASSNTVAASSLGTPGNSLSDEIWDHEANPPLASMPPPSVSGADLQGLLQVPEPPPPEVALPVASSGPSGAPDDPLVEYDGEETSLEEREVPQSNPESMQFETPPRQRRVPDIPLLNPPPPPVRLVDEQVLSPPPLREDKTILTKVDLDIYTSTAPEAPSELKTHLRTRFAFYQRRLDTHLVNVDSAGFEECLLDFWDEFFPVTANIQFYDRYTAVPRLSRLQKFLTQPCPRAIGIVQCEIERIRTSPKKGVNMKGRLFPTYEYRLFIRDRRNSADDSSGEEEQDPRRDTVIMTAKNRGKKHMDISGVVPSPGSSRKGVNNYYLYLPRQEDVNSHCKSVNGEAQSSSPNGANHTWLSPTGQILAPGLLGRLQSNFIGTEFEIFAPTVRKRSTRRSPAKFEKGALCESENDLDYDSGFSSDNPSTTSSSRRRRRFSRRSSKARRSDSSPADHPDPIDEEPCPSPDRRKSLKRSGSWPGIPYGRSSRTSRRAVAHSVEFEGGQPNESFLCEEEEGAITYTANLLGNRPRIMDVCIPKVSPDGVAGAVWKRYLDNTDDDDISGNRMLTCFRQLQQRMENLENPINSSDDDTDGDPDDDYRPPDDFGLLALQNRPPWWNHELGAFVLNFGGRVNVASVKNFQLCDRANQDYILLQFGRIRGRHSFTMDFQYPLTAVQAFAIAISSLQSKISFG